MEMTMATELNHIAQKVLDIFLEVKNVSDEYYEAKKFHLSECKNSYEALYYSRKLLGKNRVKFAKEIGVSVSDLEATYRVLHDL